MFVIDLNFIKSIENPVTDIVIDVNLIPKKLITCKTFMKLLLQNLNLPQNPTMMLM